MGGGAELEMEVECLIKPLPPPESKLMKEGRRRHGYETTSGGAVTVLCPFSVRYS